MFSGVTDQKTSFMALQISSSVRGSIFRTIRFAFAHISSMGFRSGLYLGRYFMVIPRLLNLLSSKLFLCTERLSMITTSPRLRLGNKTASIYPLNSLLLNAPSTVIASPTPDSRIADIVLYDFQEHGAFPIHGSPRFDHP